LVSEAPPVAPPSSRWRRHPVARGFLWLRPGTLLQTTSGYLEVHNDFGAIGIEVERHLAEALGRECPAHGGLGRTCAVEHEETSPAGTDHFAAQRAVSSRHVVPAVDRRMADSFRPPLLVPPVLIEEQAEALGLSLLECFPDPVAKLLCMMKVLYDGRVALLRVPFLVAEDVAATADDPGVEKQDVAAELFDRRG